MPHLFCSRVSGPLPSGVVAVMVFLCAATGSASLIVSATGISAAGRPVSFAAALTFAGDELTIVLSNVSQVESKAAADVLSSFYFDIRRGSERPPLVLDEAGGFVFRVLAGQPDQPEYYTPQTFVNEAGLLSDLRARDRGDATWLFREMDADHDPFLGFGLGTVGNSGLVPNTFNPDIVGPPGKEMINFSIFAGTDLDPVGVLDGAHLVHQEIAFRFTGAAGYGERDVVDLFAFGMGTGPDSLITVSLPEPGGLALSGIGMLTLALGFARRRACPRREAMWGNAAAAKAQSRSTPPHASTAAADQPVARRSRMARPPVRLARRWPLASQTSGAWAKLGGCQPRAS